MRCKCGSTEVYPEEGFNTIYRCANCNSIGNECDFV